MVKVPFEKIKFSQKLPITPLTRGGTGKTYASAFAMRELGFKRVLFLVHRGQLARQTKKSYEKIFPKSVSMGVVGAGYREYNADYVFATVQTLNRDEHLLQYEKDAFDCIILDESHNYVLPVWAEYCSKLKKEYRLITLDYHMDTRPIFSQYAYQACNGVMAKVNEYTVQRKIYDN